MQHRIWILLLITLIPGWAQNDSKSLESYILAQQIAKISAPLLVLVEIQLLPFNRSEEEALKDFYCMSKNNNFIEETILENIANDRPFILPGYLVAPEKILISDPYLKWERVKSLQVTDFAGVSYPAEFSGFLKDADAVILECNAMEFPLRSSAQTLLNLENTYYHVSLKGKDYQRNISVQAAPIQQYLTWSEDSPQYGFSVGTGLIFNTQLEFVGFTLPGFTAIQSLSYFHPGPLNETSEINSLQWSSIKEDLKEATSAYQALIKVSFRKRNSRGYGERSRGNEYEGYGFRVKSNLFFIPQSLTRQEVESITSIEVLFHEKTYEGQFAGLLKEWGGFLIQVNAIETPGPSLFSLELSGTSSPLLISYRANYRFGKCDPKIYFAHQTPIQSRGYKGFIFPEITHQIQAGNLFFSWDEEKDQFHFVGIGLEEKKYENSVEQTDDRRFQNTSSIFVDTASLQKRCEPNEIYLDPQAKVKTILEAKELAWLGVEFQSMNKALSEMLKVQDLTKNGNVGFLINSIYEQSPAERLGLQLGDILLELQEEGKPPETLLTRNENSYYYGYSSGRPGYPDVSWFRMNNALNQILTRMTIGSKVKLKYYSQGQVQEKEFVLEKAPRDFSSSEKYKEDITGLTVKDITYEVRHRVKLSKDFQGVIVYRVEPGSSADVAKIRFMDFIETIEDKNVRSIQDFQKIIETLLSEKKEIAKFRIRTFDETRFVDIRLKSNE